MTKSQLRRERLYMKAGVAYEVVPSFRFLWWKRPAFYVLRRLQYFIDCAAPMGGGLHSTERELGKFDSWVGAWRYYAHLRAQRKRRYVQ